MSEKNDDWCYASDRFGEQWNECDAASSREEAIAEAVSYATAHSFTPARIGWKSPCSHEMFVSGLGDSVREQLALNANDMAGDHAEEYPDMKSVEFDEALEAFVLDWLTKNAAPVRFYVIDGEEEIEVP